jgi:putative copper export protein
MFRILITAAVIVMTIAALARQVARMGERCSSHAGSRLEHALCYVAGGGQVQTFLLLPVVFFLMVIINRPVAVFLLALVCGCCLLWPAAIVSRC